MDRREARYEGQRILRHLRSRNDPQAPLLANVLEALADESSLREKIASEVEAMAKIFDSPRFATEEMTEFTLRRVKAHHLVQVAKFIRDPKVV